MSVKKQVKTSVLRPDGSMDFSWCSNCGHSPVTPNKPCSKCGAIVQKPKCKKNKARAKSLREFQLYYDY